MPWSLVDSALYHLLRGTEPRVAEAKLVDRLGAGAPEAARAVKTAQQAIACGAACAGRDDEPIDLSDVPVNRSVPPNTYRALVEFRLGGAGVREVYVDWPTGSATVRIFGLDVTPLSELPISARPTPREIFALAWQAVASVIGGSPDVARHVERGELKRHDIFRALMRGISQ